MAVDEVKILGGTRHVCDLTAGSVDFGVSRDGTTSNTHYNSDIHVGLDILTYSQRLSILLSLCRRLSSTYWYSCSHLWGSGTSLELSHRLLRILNIWDDYEDNEIQAHVVSSGEFLECLRLWADRTRTTDLEPCCPDFGEIFTAT